MGQTNQSFFDTGTITLVEENLHCLKEAEALARRQVELYGEKIVEDSMCNRNRLPRGPWHPGKVRCPGKEGACPPPKQTSVKAALLTEVVFGGLWKR